MRKELKMSALNQIENAKLEPVLIYRDGNEGSEISEIYLDSSGDAVFAARNEPQKLKPFQQYEEAQWEPYLVSAFESADTIEPAVSEENPTRVDNDFSLDCLSDSAVDDVFSSLTCTSENEPETKVSDKPENSSDKRFSPVQTSNYRKPTKLFKCPCCPYTTLSNSYFRDHQNMHTKSKPFQCEKCEFRTRHLGVLTRHMRVHMGLKPFECPESGCDKAYSHRTTLRRHLVLTHKGSVKFFHCPICPYKTMYKHTLAPHERKHNGQRPYLCANCGKKFNHAGALRNHQFIHSEEKPIKCPKCPKSFPCNSSLKKHERIHSDERPYVCQDCNCRFKHLSSLLMHKKTQKHLKKTQASSDATVRFHTQCPRQSTTTL